MDPILPEPAAMHTPPAGLSAELEAPQHLTSQLSAAAARDPQAHHALVAAYDALQSDYQALMATHAYLECQMHETADALRTSEARLAATFERAPFGVAHVALDGRWLRVNQRFCDMVGYDRATVLAQTFQAVTSPDDITAGRALAERLLAGELPLVTLEQRYCHRDDSVVWATLTVSLERTATGAPDYFLAIMDDITDRKAAAVARGQEQAQLAGIIDAAMDAIISVDADQRVVRFNQAAETLFCLPAAEALGRSIHDFLPERFRAQHQAHIQRFATTGITRRSMQALGTLHALRADGTEFPIEATISQADVGGERRFTVILRDITERQTAAQAQGRLQDQLEQEHTLLETVLLQMPAGVAIVDAATRRVILANERMQRIWGVSAPPDADLAAYATVYPMLHPDGQTYRLDERPLARALRSGAPMRTEEITFRRSDGTVGTLEANAAPVRDATGTLIAGVATFRDISVRKRAEAALQLLAEAGAVLTASLDVVPTLEALAQLAVPRLADLCTITLVAADGSLHRPVNVHRDPAKQALLERAALQFNAGGDHSLSPAATAIVHGTTVFYPTFDTAALAVTTLNAEHRQQVTTFAPCSLIAVPLLAHDRVIGALTVVMAESGRHYDATDRTLIEDLTSRAALALDNAQLYADAQQALRLRDEFLANAGHELRSPLAPLLGATQLLSDRMAADAALNAAVGRWVEVLGLSARRLRVLVESLIELGQIQAGRATLQPRPVDLAKLLRRVAGDVEAGPKHSIVVHCGEEPLTIEADGSRLEHVFTNLVENAIKYSPRGGQVLVHVERRADHVCVTVRDQGMGIPAAEQARLFTRFFRASNTGGQNGLGIGLYLAYDIVRRHGGSITVRSAEGQGTTMTVKLPIPTQTLAE